MNNIFSEKENLFQSIAEAAENQQSIPHDIAEIEEMLSRKHDVLNDIATCVKREEN